MAISSRDLWKTIDWKKPDYGAILHERARRLTEIRNSTESAKLVAELKEFYKTNPVEFIIDWGMTCDPRQAEVGLPVTMPFILFQRQIEYIEWLHARWKSREDGLAEKSREMGVSWLCVGFAVWMWIFHKEVVVGMGSRKEEYVDNGSDPKSLFWKVRQFIDLLPAEFRPAGYSAKKCAPYMRITNPENGAAIVGEAGGNIGRGNRASIYFVDEAAFLERPEDADAALSQTTNCRIDVSTPNGNGNSFYRKRFGGKVSVFQFRWQQDPRKDEEWYRKQAARLSPVVLAQEVDIDYAASVSNALISGDLVVAAQTIGPADVEAIGGWIVGVDAAHEGDDESVIYPRKGRLTLPATVANKLDGIDLARLVERRCDEILIADPGGEIAGIVIELDGPGVSAYDQLRRGKYKDAVYGIHTGKKLKDGRHYNLRALLWARGLQHLEDKPACMPVCAKTKSQLSSMKYSYKDGMLLMQDKKQYKKDFKCSPDRADAWLLTHYDVRPRAIGGAMGGGRKLSANVGYSTRKRKRR